MTDPSAGPPLEPPRPSLELLARFTVDLTAPVWDLGATSGLGVRRIVPITGGRFAGPRLAGEILDNGADWQVVTPDGATIVDTGYLLRFDDSALGYLQTRGYRHGPDEVLAALAAGDPVDPSRYYFRIHMFFETASPRYDWLNRTVVVGCALRLPNAVIYDAYHVT